MNTLRDENEKSVARKVRNLPVKKDSNIETVELRVDKSF